MVKVQHRYFAKYNLLHYLVLKKFIKTQTCESFISISAHIFQKITKKLLHVLWWFLFSQKVGFCVWQLVSVHVAWQTVVWVLFILLKFKKNIVLKLKLCFVYTQLNSVQNQAVVTLHVALF